MKLKVKFNFLFRLFLASIVIFSFFFSYRTVTRADELSDLNSQIQQKQKEKDATLKKISDIEKNIKNIVAAKGDLSSQLSQLNGQKTDLEKQIAELEKQIKSQEEIITDYSSRLAQRQTEIQEKMNYVYKLTYLQPDMIFGSEQSAKEYYDDLAMTNAAIELFRSEIRDFQDKIKTISATKTQIEEDKKKIADTRSELANQIAAVQTELNKYNSSLAAANSSKSVLSAQVANLTTQLQGLTARQKELLDAEIAKMNASKQTNQTPILAGQYFFTGRGRDLIEGHGLGMSQWGAFGMASKGWTYDQILKFYYTGVTIGDYVEPEKITVTGKEGAYPPAAKARGYLTIDEYLSGIGEVSNSWPAEAVKAQVVAARTYVMGTCGGRKECQICGTSSCQVYNGVTSADPAGLGKASFVSATKGKVILYNGAPIVAYYSASHRGHSTSINAAWGSADKPYIKPVNDDAYAYKDYFTSNPYYYSGCNCPSTVKTYNWQWRTNGYSMDQLTQIFSKSPSLNVGKVQRIDVTKDVSNRVSRITLVGTAGTKTLTGWDFRAIFNAVTPFNDYIYSTEFNFYQK
jgi:SpoIID/LytB domain protein